MFPAPTVPNSAFIWEDWTKHEVVRGTLSNLAGSALLKKTRVTASKRTETIKHLNSLYLGISVVSVIMVLVYQVALAPQGAATLYAAIPSFWYLLWNYYLWSRCNEIFYAFLHDAFDKLDPVKKSTSDLWPKDRIRLALQSYIELIVNFALLYALLPATDIFWTGGNAPEEITKALYFSGVTITTLGYGDISPNHWYPQLLVIYEVICGLILLVVCFTIYTGPRSQPRKDPH